MAQGSNASLSPLHGRCVVICIFQLKTSAHDYVSQMEGMNGRWVLAASLMQIDFTVRMSENGEWGLAFSISPLK